MIAGLLVLAAAVAIVLPGLVVRLRATPAVDPSEQAVEHDARAERYHSSRQWGR